MSSNKSSTPTPAPSTPAPGKAGATAGKAGKIGDTGKPGKPGKPYPDFPLTPHPAGYWCKKIKGTLYYFGPRYNPRDPASALAVAEEALADYLRQRDDLHAGRTPRPVTGATTMKDLANAFLNYKQEHVDSGELSIRTFGEYRATCELLVGHFGKGRVVEDIRPDDFQALRTKMAQQWAPVTLGNAIQRVRGVFKFAYDNELIDRPVRYGQAFKRPAKKVMRLDRASKGLLMFSPDEIRRMISAASPALRAMILLGINAGFGNADCGTLPQSALNLETGWLSYARPKTGVSRKAPLWPETVAALREAIAHRPAPKDPADAKLVFITKYGFPWFKEEIIDNPVSKETRKLLDSLGIDGKGRNFYCLRRTFETVGALANDQDSVDFIMGHAPEESDMAKRYRQGVFDVKLRAVTDAVRNWLFSPGAETLA